MLRKKKENYIKLSPYILIIGSILLGIILFILKLYTFLILASYVIIPCILAPFVYLYFKNKQNVLKYFTKKKIIYMDMLFVLFYFISIIILYSSLIRNIFYYLSISICLSLIVIEIIYFKLNKFRENIILTQICFIVLNLFYSINIKYYFYFGRTDVFGINNFINILNNLGTINNELGHYESFPLWVIINTIFIKIINFSGNSYYICFFISSIGYCMIILLIYKITKMLKLNIKISLFASLLASINITFISYGTYSIPRSINSIFECILLYFFLKKYSVKNISLVFLISITILLYHTISMPFIIILFLGLIIINNILIKKDNIFDSKYMLSIIIITISYYYFYSNILIIIINTIQYVSPLKINTTSIFINPISELFNYIQYSLSLFFIIYALFIIINKKINIVFIITLITIFAIPITYPSPLLLIPKLSAQFNIDRFQEYTFIFITIISSIGFYNLIKKIKYKSIIIIIFILFSLFSISNDFVASDNPLVKREFYTFYLNKEEVIAINTIYKHSTNTILSDYIIVRYSLNSEYSNKTQLIATYNNHLVNSNLSSFIRIGELYNRSLMLNNVKTNSLKDNFEWNLSYYYKDNIIWHEIYNKNITYNSKNTILLS